MLCCFLLCAVAVDVAVCIFAEIFWTLLPVFFLCCVFFAVRAVCFCCVFLLCVFAVLCVEKALMCSPDPKAGCPLRSES